MDDDRSAANQPKKYDDSPIAVLWSDADLRCLLSWDGRRYRLAVYQGEAVLRAQSADDDAVLVAVARRWRREFRAGV